MMTLFGCFTFCFFRAKWHTYSTLTLREHKAESLRWICEDSGPRAVISFEALWKNENLIKNLINKMTIEYSTDVVLTITPTESKPATISSKLVIMLF